MLNLKHLSNSEDVYEPTRVVCLKEDASPAEGAGQVLPIAAELSLLDKWKTKANFVAIHHFSSCSGQQEHAPDLKFGGHTKAEFITFHRFSSLWIELTGQP